jgi:hypothetical protein
MKSTQVLTRRAVAYALRHAGTKEAVPGLAVGLNDPDREVRYQAVIGLAELTEPEPGQEGLWGPAVDKFEQDELLYLNYWRGRFASP